MDFVLKVTGYPEKTKRQKVCLFFRRLCTMLQKEPIKTWITRDQGV